MTTIQDEARKIAERLSVTQRRWFGRQFIRIGNPTQYVPTMVPPAAVLTWKALERKGLIEDTRFGSALTPLGLQVRSLLQETNNG